jgi:hypothetical protein
MTPLRSRNLPLVLAALTAACGDPIGNLQAAPAGHAINLPVLGLGSVVERFTGEVAVRGEWAYTSTWGNRNGVPGNAVKVWNVAGPVPLLADSLIIPFAATTGDVQISTDGALLVVATEFQPGSIVIYDRTDPRRPLLLSRFGNAHTHPGVHTVKLGRVNGRHYAFLSVNPVPARLVIVDITDPRDASKRYVFLGEEGPGSVSAGTSSGDIHVIDVSDMTQPRQVAQFAVPGAGTHNFWMDEASGILYAAYYNGGVRAIDARGNLGMCTAGQRNASGFCDLRRMGREVGSALTTGSFIWGVVHQGAHVYASDMRAGLYKLDASALLR